MFKGIKGYAPKKNKIDNSGDGLLELKGKWRARAKQTMHRIARRRLKRQDQRDG